MGESAIISSPLVSGGGGNDVIESVIDDGISTLLGEPNGLLKEAALGGPSAIALALANGLLLSLPNGEALSLTGVPQSGVEFPLRPPIDSIDPLVL